MQFTIARGPSSHASIQPEREEYLMIVHLPKLAFRTALLTAIVALPCTPLQAANPASGTVSGTASQAAWTGGPLPPPASHTCGSANNAQCDNYKLTLVS